MNISIAKTDDEINSCFFVLSQLRPKLIQNDFVSNVRRMEKEGYRLAFLSDSKVLAVAGFRRMELFATGIILYVDDLVTDSNNRSKGHGEALLNWLLNEAKKLNCNYLELDSGLKRLDAHRFYRDKGMEEIGLHFSIPTDGGKKWTSE